MKLEEFESKIINYEKRLIRLKESVESATDEVNEIKTVLEENKNFENEKGISDIINRIDKLSDEICQIFQ